MVWRLTYGKYFKFLIMTVKKLILATLLFCLSHSISAQKWGFGPEFGINTIPIQTDTFGTSFKPTFHLGGVATYNLNDYFGLRAGAFFTQKTHFNSTVDTSILNLFGLEDFLGGDNLDLSVYNNTKSKANQFYLEIPILGTFHYDKFNAFLGPYVGYMVFARTQKEETTYIPVLQAVDITALDPTGTIGGFLPPASSYLLTNGSSQTGLKNLDFGIRGGVGIEFDRIGINAYYNYGLLPYRPSVQIGETKPYRHFHFSVSYLFGKGARSGDIYDLDLK